MAKWYKATNRETGEEQIICGLGGMDQEIWSILQLDKEPGITEAPGTLGFVSESEELKAKQERLVAIAQMTPEAILDRFELLESRLAALEESHGRD